MSSLIALPVAGEAFLLQDPQLGRVLVDGGFSGKTLAKALCQVDPDISRSYLNVVICTHADKDHAGGLTTLLDEGIRVKEFWLPGSWAEPVKALLTEPRTVMRELEAEKVQVLASGAPLADGSDGAEANWESLDRWLAGLTRENGTLDSAPPAIEERADRAREDVRHDEPRTKSKVWSAQVFREARKRLAGREGEDKRLRQLGDHLVHLVETAERVRAIAASAEAHGVSVRWFDYSRYIATRQASGGEAGLRPVNSVELKHPPRYPGPYLRYVQLTKVNRECLVFLADTYPVGMSVLFAGDSPLGDGSGYANSFLEDLPFSSPLIVTAPHHGSQSNAMAYGHVGDRHVAPIWLRTGGGTGHPGAAFRKIDASRRCCTHCPHLKHELRPASITAHWYPSPMLRIRSHDCTC